MPDTSRSMCSLMVRAVRGLAVSLITGSIGWPITLPWPVGNRCTTKPAAASRVTHSAAADEVSMKYSPGLPDGACADSRTSTKRVVRPIFCRFLRREMTYDEAGDALIDLTIRTCNGRLTCAETLGHREFSITKLYRSA